MWILGQLKGRWQGWGDRVSTRMLIQEKIYHSPPPIRNHLSTNHDLAGQVVVLSLFCAVGFVLLAPRYESLTPHNFTRAAFSFGLEL